MSNTVTEVALGLYQAICEDACLEFPRYEKEFRRHFSELPKLVKSRGLRVLTIDFPELGKYLERSLERGYLGSDYIHIGGRLSAKGPRLFWPLWREVFDESGTIRDVPNVGAVALLRQIFYAVKKLRMECADAYTFKAIADYFVTESHLPDHTFDWDGDTLCDWGNNSTRRVHLHDATRANTRGTFGAPELPIFSDSSGVAEEVDRYLDTLQLVCDQLVSNLGINDGDRRVDFFSITGRHGKGSVSDAKRGGWKYQFPSWGDKLTSLFPFRLVRYDRHLVGSGFMLDRFLYESIFDKYGARTEQLQLSEEGYPNFQGISIQADSSSEDPEDSEAYRIGVDLTSMDAAGRRALSSRLRAVLTTWHSNRCDIARCITVALSRGIQDTDGRNG